LRKGFLRIARDISKANRSSFLGDSLNSVYATLAGPGDELDEKEASLFAAVRL